MKNILTLILTVVCGGSAIVNAQESVDHAIAAIFKEHKGVGLTAIAVQDGKVVYEHAIGHKRISDAEALTTNDLFRIASISKSFTATALMQLVEKGRISLDDDFGTLIGFPVRNPKFPNTVITLRMVLSHTSSINDKNGYFSLDVVQPSKNINWHHSYNDYAPGEKYEYCNLNYNMAGALLERLTGVRFDQYIDQQILTPLGLQAGYCVDSLDKNRFVDLYAYHAADSTFAAQPAAYNPRSEELKNYVIGSSTPLFSPTGGLKISTRDLARYMQMHMQQGQMDGKRILRKKSAQQMQKAVSASGYGLALTNTQTLVPTVHLVGHTGSAYGLYSMMFFDPKRQIGFVLITNGCDSKFEDGYLALHKKIINLLYKEIVNK